MQYTDEERQKVFEELELLARGPEYTTMAHLHRSPKCAPHLCFHKPLQVQDLQGVNWSQFFPPVAVCQTQIPPPQHCDCAHCSVTETPRNVVKMILALMHTRNWYNRLFRQPMLKCLHHFWREEGEPSAPISEAWWKRAQAHVLKQRKLSHDGEEKLLCDWTLEQSDKSFLTSYQGACETWQRAIDEFHDDFFCVPNNGGWMLPMPRFLREWREIHPRGYRKWRRLLLFSFDALILRLLHDPQTCFNCGGLATCVMEEMAVLLATYHMAHASETRSRDLLADQKAGKALLARLPVCAWDISDDNPEVYMDLVLQDADALWLWPHIPNDYRLWPQIIPSSRAPPGTTDVHPSILPSQSNTLDIHMRFPLDFFAKFFTSEGPAETLPQQLHHVPRIHMAALRIHRFWREVCCHLQYAHARLCVRYAMESSQAAIMGQRLYEQHTMARIHAAAQYLQRFADKIMRDLQDAATPKVKVLGKRGRELMVM